MLQSRGIGGCADGFPGSRILTGKRTAWKPEHGLRDHPVQGGLVSMKSSGFTIMNQPGAAIAKKLLLLRTEQDKLSRQLPETEVRLLDAAFSRAGPPRRERNGPFWVLWGNLLDMFV
jgi:hypothetical protein